MAYPEVKGFCEYALICAGINQRFLRGQFFEGIGYLEERLLHCIKPCYFFDTLL